MFILRMLKIKICVCSSNLNFLINGARNLVEIAGFGYYE